MVLWGCRVIACDNRPQKGSIFCEFHHKLFEAQYERPVASIKGHEDFDACQFSKEESIRLTRERNQC